MIKKNNLKEIIIKVFYALSALGYITYLFTEKSAFMFCGGLFLIVASIMLIINNKNKTK